MKLKHSGTSVTFNLILKKETVLLLGEVIVYFDVMARPVIVLSYTLSQPDSHLFCKSFRHLKKKINSFLFLNT